MDSPAWLMCPPDYYTAEVANNAWMDELTDRKVDSARAAAQWRDIYEILTSLGIVYLQPPKYGLQDQVFTANAGVMIGSTFIVSCHSTHPRMDESAVTGWFTAQLPGIRTRYCPHRFEGEAELKHLHDNVYVGGHGQRTDPKAYDWITSQHNVKIITVKERDEHLYHLDCYVFPLTPADTLVCTAMFTKKELRALEAETNVIDVTEDEAFAGITNSLRAEHLVLNGSHINELTPGTPDYQDELQKNRRLEDLCVAHDLEPVFVNVSEYHKGGALLSCLAMRLA